MIWFGGCSRNTIAIFRSTMMFSELLAGEDQIKHFNHTAKILDLSFYYPRRSVQQQTTAKHLSRQKKSQPTRAGKDFQHLCGVKRANFCGTRNLTLSKHYVRSRGKQLVLFSRGSWCFPRRRVFCHISRLSLQRTSTATKEYALAERIKTVDSVLIRTQI